MIIRTDPRTGMKYADYMSGGKRVRVSLRTKNQKIAIIKAAKLADDKKADKDGKISLDAFLNRLREYTQATKKKNTQYRYELAWRQLLEWRSFDRLEQITPAVLDEFSIYAKSKIRKSTAAGLNRNVRAIKASMRQAEFWDLIPPQNWRKVSKFKESKGRVEFHSMKEIKQILKLFNPDWQLVVLLGCRAGLRRGEIANLKWSDVDFKNNQLYVAPNKTDNFRYIPLADDLRKALEKRKSSKQEYVVNVGETGNRNDKDYLSAYYRKVTAGLPFNCFMHKLRHTFASHLVQEGVDLYRVSKLMGHSSIRMTEIYAHLAPQDLTSAIKKLPTIK